MRKWVAVGVVLAVIGLCAYLLCPPRSGSIEYHKGEFLRLGYGDTAKWIDEYAPPKLADMWQIRRWKRARFHYEALEKLGYFEERLFLLSHRSLQRDLLPRQEFRQFFSNDLVHFVSVSGVGTNSVRIRAPKDEMAAVERAVRSFDVPQK